MADMDYSTSDQNMFGANDLQVLDPAITGIPGTGAGLRTNNDLDKFLVPGSSNDGNAPAVFTPGMMRFISGVWTPSLDMQFGTDTCAQNDQLGYFGNTIQPSSADPRAVVSEQQTEPKRGKRQSQSSSLKEESAAGAQPPKKKRRERKKKVKTQEEEQRNRENFLERNRKAAQKCRQRKKVWMEDIQRKKDAASELMNILGMEVIHLVEEVKTLRAFTDAHKSCEHGTLKPPTDSSVAGSMSKKTSQPAPQSKNFEARRRDSEATVNTFTTDEGSADDMMGMSPIEQHWEEFSDPCWKLAKEACRRFSEIHPDFIPMLPRMLRRDAYQASRSSSLGSDEGHGEHDGLIQDFDHRIDSGFSEMSTPHDAEALPSRMDVAPESKGRDLRNTTAAPSSTLVADSNEADASKELIDLQRSATFLPRPGLSMGDLKLPSFVSVS